MRTTPSLLLLSFIAVGCGGGAAVANQQAWAQAAQEDTCEAYEAFLNDHPRSKEATEARSRHLTACDQEEWTKATAANTQAAYQTYLNQHTGGAHAADARKVLAVRAVKRVGLDVSSRNCSEDSCPFIAIAKKVLQNAGIAVADRGEASDVVVKIDSSISLLEANRTETLPYSSLEGSISVQVGGSSAMSRQFNGRATGGWEVYGVHQTPRWPSTPTVFNAAPVEETMASLVRDFFGR
jgi:hypothetical protein